MINKYLKKQLDDFISDTYDEMYSVATTYYPKDPSELIASTYESILNGNETPFLLDCFENDRVLIFFNGALRNNRFTLMKEEQKLKYNEIVADIKFEEDDTIFIKRHIQIMKAVNELEKNKQISWYQKRIWYFMYDIDALIDIKNISAQDMKYLRKMSLRKMEKFLGISYVTIHYALTEVKHKLNKYYNFDII